MDTPSFREDHISQIPALQLLINLGYQYLTPEEALELRGGKKGKVILTPILEKQLREINEITFKGETYQFSNSNITKAIKEIDDVMIESVGITNQKIHDLICLGKSFEENIQNITRSYTLKYIDWGKTKDNVFHVTEEFEVETDDGRGHRRPDIVLFVNGIPFAVIECKRPDIKDSIDAAVSQHIRNQKKGEIQRLFIYSQVLLGISKNEAKYATATTNAKFWAIWREPKDVEDEVSAHINRQLSEVEKDKLFGGRYRYIRYHFDQLEAEGRKVTEQDRAIFSLLRKDRLMELTKHFILYDKGIKKIARYQQYFAVKKTLRRVKTFKDSSSRNGGVIWHTQGSGKSLTMVWLSKALTVDSEITNPRVVIVTDRINLDKQIKDTFADCEMEPERAKTGEDLLRKLEDERTAVITTVIDKFESAIKKRTTTIDDPNIFVLVDESHRSQYGESHAQMRRVLPKACYIGFTGTPLMRKDKNTVDQFGGFIDQYTIDRAVKDKAVVPLLYEGREVPQEVEQKAIDTWFEMTTRGLSDEQKADLKKKYSRISKLNSTEQKIHMIAFDISMHYSKNWKGTDFKAQIATPNKLAAIKYKKYLDEIDEVVSEVVISSPDTREGNEDHLVEVEDDVVGFWKRMMERFGTEEQYNLQIINGFKNGEEPEIIIVVDKLLTGFDAPNNTVLYITKEMREHTLLQAIARVNRIRDDKEFGYIIDYAGILGNLDQALTQYSALESYDENDLEGALANVLDEIKTLPQKHSALVEIFKEVKNKRDEEEYELLLAEKELRDTFYERLSAFSKTLSIALSVPKFYDDNEEKIKVYKSDLKFYQGLRSSVKKRYAEVVEIGEYEPKIQKLLDTYVTSHEVETITDLVNIFDKDEFEKEIAKIVGKGSKADTIAHRTMKTIQDKWEEDPAFYEKFSKMLQDAIDNYHQKRIDENDYFSIASDIKDHVINRKDEDEPPELEGREIAKAFYGVTFEVLTAPKYKKMIPFSVKNLAATLSIAIDDVIRDNRVVDWHRKDDIQNKMMKEISDILWDKEDLNLEVDDIDMIIERIMHIARRRYAE